MPAWESIPGRNPQPEDGAVSTAEGGPCVVILYNCDCHAFDEVIAQLQKATGCDLRRAVAIAVEAHTLGRAVAFTGDRQDCERAASILRAIRLQVETDSY